MVLGGTSSMPGAPILASLAALRCGAGLVTKAHLDSAGHILPPEVMLMSANRGSAVLNMDFLPLIKERIEAGKITSLVIGPGMGTAPETVEFLKELLSYLGHKKLPYVLDADGLNILSTELNRPGSDWDKISLEMAILTPHPLEMARLLGCKVEEINDDRYSTAKKLAQKLKCVVVLKGASSVVYAGNCGFVNSTGNPFMATGGAGDALSGILAALVAQGFSPLEAACTGTFLHGAAGDYAHESSGSFIIASDIIAAIPRVARVLYD
jgi:NAD(P)H-hydrate epimerase